MFKDIKATTLVEFIRSCSDGDQLTVSKLSRDEMCEMDFERNKYDN